MAAGSGRGPVRRLLAASVRYVPRPAFAGVGGLLFWVTWVTPRRLPNLARFSADAGFGLLRDPAVEWTSAQAGHIEAVLPWLTLVGQRLDDYCQVSADKTLDLRLAPIGARCHRDVIAVYGADGLLRARLAELGRVLGQAGWGEFFSYGGTPLIPKGSLESQRPPVSSHWRSAPQEAVPPAGVKLARLVQVGWASRGQPPDPKWTLDGRWYQGGPRTPEPPRAASRYCQPVDCRYADTEALAADALAKYEHTIVIRWSICYYFNPDVQRFPMRRRILPSRK